MAEIPISELSFARVQELRPRIVGWIHPKRNVSPFIPLFSKPQQIALNCYGWVAMLMVPAGLALPFIQGSWWWLALLPGAVIVWRANRKSMEQFFIENLANEQAFFEAAQASSSAQFVKLVIREGREGQQ